MKIYFTIFSLIPILVSFPQQDTSYLPNETINDILENSTEDDDDPQLYSLIEDLGDNKININSAAITDLLKIPTIDLQTAQLIIEYRNMHGEFSVLQDLHLIKELDDETIKNIIPFFTVEKSGHDESDLIELEPINKLGINFRSRFSKDIQNRKGYVNNQYEGNKNKIYNRLKGRYGNYKINILTEKDAGEKSISDFYSFSFSADKLFDINRLVLGDFLVEFGQGLALWGPYAFSKGSEAVSTVIRNGRGIVPYSSSDENQFFRGAAAEIKYSNFDLSIFYSSNKKDADISEDGFIESSPIDGYHRTSNEIENKNKAVINSFGSFIAYSPLTELNFGLLYYNSKFSSPFSIKNIYDFHGSNFNLFSISYSLLLNKFYLKGEVSYNGTSAASINNIHFLISKSISFIVSIRNYPRNYFNLNSKGFGESSDTKNEFGIYSGLKVKLSSTIFNIYFDQFIFPFASFSLPLKSQGSELLIDVSHSFSSKIKLRFRYTNERKEIKTLYNLSQIIADQVKQKFRTEFIYNVSKNIRLRSRIEYSKYAVKRNHESSNGFLIYQDIRFAPSEYFNIYARLIFFDTDSYDSRIYEFENDLTGVLNNAALFGKGTKWYMVINYRLFENFNLSAKFSELYQPELRQISSGLNEINGNLLSKISLQLDIKM